MRPGPGARFLGPLDNEDSVVSALQAELVQLARIFDPEKVDMPDRWFKFLVWLDDREARARHISPVTKRGENAACKRRLPDAKRA